MRILLITYDFPPVLKSAARLFYELAEDLLHLGHEVRVLTSIPEGHLAKEERHYRHRFLLKEKMNGINVWRLKNVPVPRHIPMLRAMEQFFVALTSFVAGCGMPRQDVIIVYSPPLPLGLTGYRLAKKWKSKVILNVQDIYPQTPIDLGLLNNQVMISMAEGLARYLYQRSDAITVHSEGNKQFLINKGAEDDRVRVIPNWVDLNEVRPGPLQNQWRQRHGLNNDFIISFAGTMGFAQGLEDILDVADKLHRYQKIRFVFAGDGVFQDSLRKKAQDQRLTNICFLPPQPKENYLELLQASNACLVTLNRDLKTPVVPGKLQTAMSAGRAVICFANPASDARKIIEEAKCGVFVPAHSTGGLIEAILALYNKEELTEEMGRNGRSYAEDHFNREACTLAYHHLLVELHGKG